MGNNFKHFRNGITLSPSFSSDPLEGKLGEMYYNTSSNTVRLCISSSPLKWTDCNLPQGTDNLAPLIWSTVDNAWVENNTIELGPSYISSKGGLALTLKSADSVVGSTLVGGDILITTGAGDSADRGKVRIDAHSLVIGTPHIDNPTLGEPAEIYYNTVSKQFRFFDGLNWRPIGGGGGFVKITAVDTVSVILPVTPAPTLDGYVLQENDLVLFTNLDGSDGYVNNLVYKLADLANPAWSPAFLFEGSVNPVDGDTIMVMKGTNFGGQQGLYLNSEWVFSKYRRQFNGNDFFEESAVFSVEVLDNTQGELYRVAALGSEYSILDYSLKRGSTREVGQLYVMHDGTNATVTGSNGSLSDTGVSFSVGLDGTELVLYYDADNMGTNGVFKFTLKRWSDASGGPSGPPSYTGFQSNTGAASGSAGSIQFSDGTNLTSSENIKYNSADKALEMNGLQFLALSDEINLNDDQPAPATIFTYPKEWEFCEVEYSLERGTDRRRGRLLIINNGTNVEFSDDFAEINDCQIMWQVVIIGGNVAVQYISVPTGFPHKFRYHALRWQ